MNVDDLILISIDDHVIEPGNMFDNHVPSKYRNLAPKVVRDANGMEVWEFQGAVQGSAGLNAVVSWPKDEWGLDPTTFAEMRPGAYDVNERIRDMNHNGVLASMNFPTMAGFSGKFFHQAPDKDLALVMLKAYNDWHIDEWCASHPGRFLGCGLLPLWDPASTVAEIRRLKDKGFYAVTLPEMPHLDDWPSYHNLDYWGPVFDALSDTGLVMCLHIGQGFGAIRTAPEAPIDNLIILSNQISLLAAQDLLWGGAFLRYPKLKVAWSEGGVGWIPFYLNRCDRHYTNQTWLGHDFGGKLPSEIFREHSLACYISDPASLRIRDVVGIDSIAWECDYPHSDSVWPGAPEFLLGELNAAGCSDEEIDKITWQNSARFLGYSPFDVIAKENATVGALRALSPDVDETIRSRSEWRARYEKAAALRGVS
jgi:predicted TIM-barrel fold metal-dependent hydrolase